MSRILFLGGNFSKELIDWLEKQGEQVFFKNDEVTFDKIKSLKPDFIISYNYRYIISSSIVKFFSKKIINLHISLLPWNRGAHPNIWSFLEETPKGVTIHYVDAGIDTGDILFQEEIEIDEDKHTLKSSYLLLNKRIQALFKAKWREIKSGKVKSWKQPHGGTIHFKRDLEIFKPLLEENGWDLPICEFKQLARKLIANSK